MPFPFQNVLLNDGDNLSFTRLAPCRFLAMTPFVVLICIANDTRAGHQEVDRMTQKIAEAAAKRLGPEVVGEFVGKRAVLNTTRTLDKAGIGSVVIIDAKTERRIKTERAKFVVVWRQDVKGSNPQVLGLIWSRQGTRVVFQGEIAPP